MSNNLNFWGVDAPAALVFNNGGGEAWMMQAVAIRYIRKQEVILLYELVVHTVIASPVGDGAPVCHGVTEHQQDTNGPVRVVGTVRPQAVYATCDS